MAKAARSGSQAPPRTRPLTILAQDPAVLLKGRPLTAVLPVPLEDVVAGPRGHRVHVLDYDSSRDRIYGSTARKPGDDPFTGVHSIRGLVEDHHFHQQNVYAIV